MELIAQPFLGFVCIVLNPSNQATVLGLSMEVQHPLDWRLGADSVIGVGCNLHTRLRGALGVATYFADELLELQDQQGRCASK